MSARSLPVLAAGAVTAAVALALALAVALAASAAGCGAPVTAGDDPIDAAVHRPDAAPADAEAPLFSVQYSDPDHGPFRGGDEIQIRGNGFAEGDEVWIGGRRVLDQTFIDSRRFEVVTPPGEPGAADVEVRHGGQIAVDPGGFRYDAIALDPPSGSIAGGTFVTLTGLGTDFDAGTTVTLDGVPMTGVTVVDAQRLTGFTPPGVVGDADVVVRTGASVYTIDRGYTYFTTGDPFAGGMSGGHLAGVLNVVVLDNWTRDGIEGAWVSVGDPATSPYQGRTDALGQITFSGADLVGPVTVWATATDHEVASFHCFDAANLTIWLRSPIPPPSSGPPGVGPTDGEIHGQVLFGNATGQGSPFWPLVPEPRTPTEVKRIYVTTSAPTIFSSPRPPLEPIDYAYDPDRVSWDFEVRSRPGAYAVVALAGLYDPARDPDGTGVVGFEPFALGVTRGVLVGPGQTVDHVDVVVDIPLDAAALVDLDDPPPLGTPGWLGPSEYAVRAFVDLGGDGAIAFGRHGLPPVVGLPPPGQFNIPRGETSILLANAPPRFGAIGDASYAFVVNAWTGGADPFSARIVRGVGALGALTIGDFLGTPRPLDPAPDATASARHVVFAAEGPQREPTFHLHMLSGSDGRPLWRGVTCGALRDVELPDLTSWGVPDWPPAGEQTVWTVYAIAVEHGSYDDFTYRWMGANYWDAYAADANYAYFPGLP
ncbi:MAG: IPT/TIG domain-containing protein [Kofleriaceae bacterium]|nr:IPT/TIG domain-containing protein [Kofleriaceae bacterium]